MGVPNQRRHENATFLAGLTGTHCIILRNLRSLTNKSGQKEKKRNDNTSPNPR